MAHLRAILPWIVHPLRQALLGLLIRGELRSRSRGILLLLLLLACSSLSVSGRKSVIHASRHNAQSDNKCAAR